MPPQAVPNYTEAMPPQALPNCTDAMPSQALPNCMYRGDAAPGLTELYRGDAAPGLHEVHDAGLFEVQGAGRVVRDDHVHQTTLDGRPQRLLRSNGRECAHHVGRAVP